MKFDNMSDHRYLCWLLMRTNPVSSPLDDLGLRIPHITYCITTNLIDYNYDEDEHFFYDLLYFPFWFKSPPLLSHTHYSRIYYERTGTLFLEYHQINFFYMKHTCEWYQIPTLKKYYGELVYNKKNRRTNFFRYNLIS